MDRREFLQILSAGAAGLALSEKTLFAAHGSTSKPLRGIFPIAQTPFTESNQLDLDSLVAELKFIDKGRVHGFVWPQLASEWDTLSESERLEGAEAIASTGKKLRPAIVIGVQAPETATAVRYAKHAARVGADAIISLPPAGQNDGKTLLEYYQAIGAATELPLFVQAVGNMGVETILNLYRNIPTLRYVKDEAGQPLMRVGPLRSESHDEIKVFTGGHGKTLIDEMVRGFSGSMPAASFADVYAASWDLWHQGKKQEALNMFGTAAVLINEISVYDDGMKYILHLRGVFKTYGSRQRAHEAGGATNRTRLDEMGKRVLREMLDLMKPHLRA
jgi:dihydrodipicolinate synthase/N-acetylneuraminate lyase